MQKYLKFTGKFTELIPNGWTFWKAFANNYRVYSKTSNGGEFGPCFTIWQHLGGYVEFESFFSNSWLIFEWVKSGEYKNGVEKLFSNAWYQCMFNRDTGTLEKYVFDKHSIVSLCIKETNGELSKEEIKQLREEFSRKYREVVITDEEVNFILDMFDRGWVEIAEDKRKTR